MYKLHGCLMDCHERIHVNLQTVSFSAKCDWMLLRGLDVYSVSGVARAQGPETGVGARENKEDQDQHSMSQQELVVAELR